MDTLGVMPARGQQVYDNQVDAAAQRVHGFADELRQGLAPTLVAGRQDLVRNNSGSLAYRANTLAIFLPRCCSASA
jgi:hypothetical protein